MDRRVIFKGSPLGPADPVTRRLAREAKLLAEVNHPGVVKVLQVGSRNEGAFIVLEYLHGANLEEHVRATGPVALVPSLGLTRAMAEALDVVHRMGILHRDIKPQNVVLVDDRGPVLIDFGLANRDDQTRISMSGDILGTPSYLAPELALGEAPSAASDLYALGLVLHFLLLGRATFYRGTISAALEAQIDQPPEVIPGLPAGVQELLDRMLSKIAADRPDSAAEVVEALVRLQADPTATAAGTPAPLPPAPLARGLPTASLRTRQGSRPASRRGMARAISGAALLLVAIAFVAWALPRRSADAARAPAPDLSACVVSGRVLTESNLRIALPAGLADGATVADAGQLRLVPGAMTDTVRWADVVGPGAALGDFTVEAGASPGAQRVPVRVVGALAWLAELNRSTPVIAARTALGRGRPLDAARAKRLRAALEPLAAQAPLLGRILTDERVGLDRRLELHRLLEELHGPFREQRDPAVAPLAALGATLAAWIPRDCRPSLPPDVPADPHLVYTATPADESLGLAGMGDAAVREFNRTWVAGPRRVHDHQDLEVDVSRDDATRPAWIVLEARRLGHDRWLDVEVRPRRRVRIRGLGRNVDVEAVFDPARLLAAGGRDALFPILLLRARLPAGIFREGSNTIRLRAGSDESEAIADSFPALSRVWLVPERAGR